MKIVGVIVCFIGIVYMYMFVEKLIIMVEVFGYEVKIEI